VLVGTLSRHVADEFVEQVREGQADIIPISASARCQAGTALDGGTAKR
jgi:hypothetical protein